MLDYNKEFLVTTDILTQISQSKGSFHFHTSVYYYAVTTFCGES